MNYKTIKYNTWYKYDNYYFRVVPNSINLNIQFFNTISKKLAVQECTEPILHNWLSMISITEAPAQFSDNLFLLFGDE